MNNDLTKAGKNDFEKYFSELMNNAVFGNAMENVGEHLGIKLITTEKGRNYLVLEPNYNATKFFSEICWL